VYNRDQKARWYFNTGMFVDSQKVPHSADLAVIEVEPCAVIEVKAMMATCSIFNGAAIHVCERTICFTKPDEVFEGPILVQTASIRGGPSRDRPTICAEYIVETVPAGAVNHGGHISNPPANGTVGGTADGITTSTWEFGFKKIRKTNLTQF
jgi:hypothetical protein